VSAIEPDILAIRITPGNANSVNASFHEAVSSGPKEAFGYRAGGKYGFRRSGRGPPTG
jgi:hypothetical protein